MEKNSYDFEDVTEDIALGYWRRGNARVAFEQIDKVGPEKRLEFLCYFATQAAREKRPELARQALTRALELVASDSELDDQTWISGFIQPATDVGELQLALKFVDLLDNGSERRARALISIAESFGSKGQKDRAIALLDSAIKQFDSFDEDERRDLIDLSSQATTVFLGLSEKQRALELTNRTYQNLMSQAKPDSSDAEKVGLSYARIGDGREALQFGSLEDANALVSLALTYAGRGEDAAALSFLVRARQHLDSADDREMRKIVEAYVQIGRLNDAVEVLREMTNTYDLSKGAMVVAAAFKDRSRKQEALAVLNIAFSRIRKVVSEESEEIPAGASWSVAMGKSHALLELADAFIEIGELDGAEAVANAIDQPQYKSLALAKAALGYARVGDVSKARMVLDGAYKLSRGAKKYNHDGYREQTLYRIAEAYAAAGFKQETAKVADRVLRELWTNDPNRRELISVLFELGAMMERDRIPVGKDTEAMLARILKRFEDDN